jgi:hypothetical protein
MSDEYLSFIKIFLVTWSGLMVRKYLIRSFIFLLPNLLCWIQCSDWSFFDLLKIKSDVTFKSNNYIYNIINFFSTNESWALLHWSVFSCLIYFFINNKYDVQKFRKYLIRSFIFLLPNLLCWIQCSDWSFFDYQYKNCIRKFYDCTAWIWNNWINEF